jgi:hypothetical protein
MTALLTLFLIWLVVSPVNAKAAKGGEGVQVCSLPFLFSDIAANARCKIFRVLEALIALHQGLGELA